MTVDLFSADYSRLADSDIYTAIAEFTRQNLPPNDRAQEGYTVDFKEKWSEKSLRVVAAFANTFGGIIIIGVSEDGGRAKDLVGEDSKGELKTRLASSIAASISPTPNFEIAECTLASQPDRRLAVIRVRPSNRIHFLITKDSPVYVRNEDQAIPARAAELRNLIQREREAEHSSTRYLDQGRLMNLLPITKARKSDENEGKSRPQRIASPSFVRLWVIPDQTCSVALDYDTELTFRDIVFKTFPPDSFLEDSTWDSTEEMVRDRSFVRIDYAHVQRDLQSKWALTSNAEFGYATPYRKTIRPVVHFGVCPISQSRYSRRSGQLTCFSRSWGTSAMPPFISRLIPPAVNSMRSGAVCPSYAIPPATGSRPRCDGRRLCLSPRVPQ